MINLATPSFDRQLVPQATLDDLDLDSVQRMITHARNIDRIPEEQEPLAYLARYHGVVHDQDTVRPTVAGLIAFGRTPDRWLPSSGADVAHFRYDTVSPTSSRVRQIRGSVFHVIDKVFELLKEYCTVDYLDGAQLTSTLDIPEIVLRELTTNALVHRDLSVYGSQVRIQVYPTQIEWVSPGGLPAGITVETLLTAQFARNPSLAQFLFHAGYIEKFGMGLDAVTHALLAMSSKGPEFFDDKHSFRVLVHRLRNHPMLGPDLRTREGRTALIMALFVQRPVWQQRELLSQINVSRSTLQRDLMELVEQGRLVAHGATRTRIYTLPSYVSSLQLGFNGFASDEAN